MHKKFLVNKDYHNSRFDRWFKHNVNDVPQSLLEKFLRKKKVKVNKKKIKSSHRLQLNDIVEIYGIDNLKPKIQSKNIKYQPTNKEKEKYDKFIIENNDNFIVINKPSGIPVQSGTKSFKNIIDILKNTKYFENTKPYVVHRLDKETSGVMIVAKNREYAQLFTSLFRIRKIHKTYLAITYGAVKKGINLLQDNLVTYEKNKKIVQKAISHLKILKINNDYSFLELKPITGRKHQLRKQLYNIGNPIIGDDKYSYKLSKKKSRVKNIMLHAHKIKFMINNIKYNFEAKYGDEFESFIKKQF
ncbi:MAG: RNA pseudouridine synthase [Pelagibacteraceae bacterium TMED124]|nr:MAG: RNA pseudouridine synthase [Pelagibacteraceae bacterium TMED124]